MLKMQKNFMSIRNPKKFICMDSESKIFIGFLVLEDKFLACFILFWNICSSQEAAKIERSCVPLCPAALVEKTYVITALQ